MRLRGFVVALSLAALLAATPGFAPLASASTFADKKPASEPGPSPSPGDADEESAVRASCALYPLALPADLVDSATPGATLSDIALGTGPGNFSWLSWTGDMRAPTLAQSLLPPGDKETYVNPDDASDSRPDVGDWVSGSPGVMNSAAIRANLDALKGDVIALPTWSETRGTGANLHYEIAAIANIRLLDYRLSGRGTVSVEFVGYTSCYNQPPVAVGQDVSTDNETPLAIALGASDPDGDELAFRVVSGPDHGTVGVDGSAVIYTPEPGYVGLASFTFVANDGYLDSEMAMVTIDVVRANHPPVAVSQEVSTDNETPVVISLGASDPDGDGLTFRVATAPDHGTVAVDGATATYTPEPGYVGPASFTFVANDGYLDSEPASVTIDVERANHPPVAVGQEVSTDNETPLAITLEASDPDGDELSFRIATIPEHGTVALDGATAAYTPEAGYVGPASFTFVANDGLLDSGPATVTLEVHRANHPPSITSTPVVAGVVDESYVYEVAGSDPDGDELTFSLESAEPGVAIDPETGAIGGMPVSLALAESVDRPNLACTSFSRSVGELDPKLRWKWLSEHPDMISDVYGPPMVARIVDINGDGVVDDRDPPTVVFGAFTSTVLDGAYLVALNGDTGEELWISKEKTVSGFAALAVGDIDSDGRPDIVGIRPGPRTELAAFDDGGHLKWVAPTGPRNSSFSANNPRDWVSIADLDGDGSPEVIHGNRVFDGQGNLLWTGAYETGGYVNYGVGSVVADLDQNGYQEVLAGRVIYTHDGQVQARNTALPASGFNSIADFDGDGEPEIVYVAQGSVYLLDRHLTVIWGPRVLPGGGEGGPATIADLTGDGYPEIAVAARSRYVVYDRFGAIVWQRTVQDYTSHKTGSSVFDFTGDGRASVLYADEVNFYVFDGPTGATQYVVQTGSGTTYEYPLVVDVTGDGSANVVVPSSGNAGIGGGLYVYESGDLGWMPTRTLWNQHAYSIDNINDDGSVPTHPAASWLTHNTYRLNSFFDHEPFASADLAVRGLELHGDGPEYTVTVEVENRGLADYPAPASVAFSGVGEGGAELPLGSVDVPPLARGERTTIELTGVTAEDIGDAIRAVVEPHPGADQCETGNDWTAAQAVTVRATDPGGLFAEQLYLLRLTAAGATPPEIDEQEDLVIEARGLFRHQVVAHDQDRGDGLRFTLVQAPRGMWMDAGTGEVFWRTNDLSVGSHNVIVSVEDLAGLSDETTFAVVVTPSTVTTEPPTITSPPVTKVAIGGEFRYDVTATSPEGLSLNFALVIAPAGMTIDAQSGEIFWRPSTYQTGERFVVVRATDSSSQFDIQEFVVFVSGTNHPPAILSEPPPSLLAGAAYAYDVEASDPDGDVVSFELRVGPEGMLIDANTGLVTWDTSGVLAGAYSVQVAARDFFGGVAVQAFAAIVVESNEAPAFLSIPELEVVAGQTYAYQPTVSDADGDDLTFALVEAPSGMTVDASTGTITWDTNGVAPGAFPVEIAASDGRGGSASQSFDVTVVDPAVNRPPRVTSTPPATAFIGQAWVYPIAATDPDGDTLAFALIEGPDGATIDAHGTITWTPSAEQSGGTSFVVEVTDGAGGWVRQSFTLAVSAATSDLTPPVIALENVTVTAGETATIPVGATDDVGVVSLTVTVGGVDYPIDPDGFVSVATTEPGLVPVVATASDAAGHTTVVNAWLQIVGADDGSYPTAAFGEPGEGAELSVATPIVGTADDEHLSRWELTATPVRPTGSEPIVLGSGTTAVVDGQLGVFDATVLAGGEWRISLEVTDEGGLVSRYSYVVTSVNEAKYGLFSLTFTDAVIPVAGMPITVQRTYDSGARTRLGDFGFGWSLGIQSLRLETDNAPGDGWIRENQGTYLPNWVLIPTKPHTVTIVDGANQSIVFDFTPTLIDPIVDGRYATAAWTERTTTGATLEPVDTVDLVQSDQSLLSLDTVETYEPPSYLLTMPDGRQFTFSVADGMTAARDANGNTLTISATGITSSTGASVAFARDAEGRITSVTTPSGLVTRYAYDGAGNLATVTDPEGNVTTFAYGSGHYLTGIVDPLGRVPDRNEYDEAGRLVAVVDAAGNRIEISSDPDTRTETVTDRLGHTTVRTYDERGKVVAQTFADGTSETYTNDADGNRTSRTDGLGNTWTATYDDRHHRTSITDPLGNTRTFEYDAAGHLVRAVDALGRVTTVTYDSAGNATRVTYPDGSSRVFTYDARGNLLSEADELGWTTFHTYDSLGRLATTTTPGGHTTTYAYDTDGRLTSTTDPEGGVRTSTYNGVGQVTSSTDPLGEDWSTTYDAVGARTASTDPLGGTTSMTYDDLGRLATTTGPEGGTTSYVYDAEGRITSTTSPDGITSATTYDARGRVLSTSTAGIVTSTRTYDAAGRVATTMNALGETTTFSYDAAGRTTSVTGADGQVTSYTYDAAGQVLSSTGPAGTTSYGYDLRGRTTSVTGPDGAVTELEYDAAGHVTRQVAPDGAATVFAYDADGRLASATDAGGNTAEVSYDGNGQRVSVVDPEGRTRVWDYDAAGNLLQYTVAGQVQLTQVFDAAGRLTSTAAGDGAATAYEYDAAGRLTRIVYPDGTDAVIDYTPAGRRASVIDARGTTTYSYDARGRLTTVASPEGTLGYTYDDAGRVASMTTPAGTTSYTRDTSGRITGLTDPEGGVYAVARDDAGRITSVAYPNAVTEAFAYDTAGRPVSASVTDGAGTVLAAFTGTRDVTGRLGTVSEVWDGAANRSQAYTYDAAGRLVSVATTVGGASTTSAFTLDGVGNRISVEVGGTVTAQVVNDLDQLTSSGASSYAYDAAGRLTSATGPAGTTTYGWGADGRLASVTAPSSDAVSYVYDVDGSIATRTDTTGTVSYLSDASGGLARAVWASDGTWWVYVGSMPLAQHTSTGTVYLASDLHQDVRLATDDAGVVADRFDWSADGKLTSRTGTTPITVGYRGEASDPTTGLIWLHARWYDPTTARFLSADPWMGNPATPASLNRYAYANADPVNGSDPTGRYTLTEQQAVMVIGGTLLAIGGTYWALLQAGQAPTITLPDIDWSIPWKWFDQDSGIDEAKKPEPKPQPEPYPIPPQQPTDRLQCDDANDPSCSERVVIGESRVRTRGAAVALDAQAWVGVPERTPQAATCAANLAWIESAMDRGVIIFDIGIDASRQGSRSPYYELERVAVARRGYPTIPTVWPPSPSAYYVEPQPACPM